MSEIQRNHLRLVDAVNDAKTEREHDDAMKTLFGFRCGVSSAGREPDLMGADWHTGSRYGFPELGDGCPPMCCGVRLDWTPNGYKTAKSPVVPKQQENAK